MDSAWQATVHGVAKSWTQLSTWDKSASACSHTHLPWAEHIKAAGIYLPAPQAGEQTWITFLASNKETHNEIQSLFQRFFISNPLKEIKLYLKK